MTHYHPKKKSDLSILSYFFLTHYSVLTWVPEVRNRQPNLLHSSPEPTDIESPRNSIIAHLFPSNVLSLCASTRRHWPLLNIARSTAWPLSLFRTKRRGRDTLIFPPPITARNLPKCHEIGKLGLALETCVTIFLDRLEMEFRFPLSVSLST